MKINKKAKLRPERRKCEGQKWGWVVMSQLGEDAEEMMERRKSPSFFS